MALKRLFTPKFPHLMSTLRIGDVTLNNRMVSAPMGFPYITEKGLVTNELIAFYELRAKGGASLVTVSEAVTHPTGKSHGRLISLYADGALQGLTDLARAIKRHGALASMELNHGGMFSEMDILDEERDDGLVKYGPSDLVLPDGKIVKEMPKSLIDEIVESFRKSASLIKRAGFDMVMIHGGHGWLIEQFLSPATNKRTDEYGGSVDNRVRLAYEIIDAVRDVVGDGFPIEFRMSGMENIPGGYDLDGAVEIAKRISKKVDIIHVSAGFGEENFEMTHPSMFDAHGSNVHLAAEIKRHVTVPVVTVGGLNNPYEMERLLSSGRVDVIAMGRALLADPELPRKIESGQDEDIIKCLRCFTCHAERMLTQTRVCAVNPVIGKEFESKFALPQAKPKRVLVVGGGPAGITAAYTAAQRGHTVTLCEKKNRLGGALLAEIGVSFKKEAMDFVKTRERQMRRAGIDIRFGVDVNTEIVRRIAPDAMIVAVGAEPMTPGIPGIDRNNVINAIELTARIDEVGDHVAVIGGGLAGCEMSLYLAQNGKKVTIVEKTGKLATEANPRHRPILLKMVQEHASSHTNTLAVAVVDEGLLVSSEDGVEKLIEADTIVVATGMRPLRAVADSLRGLTPETSFIGDCVSARNIREAVFRGYHAALDL